MLSKLFNLLLAYITILLRFILFLVVVNNLFTIPVETENARLKLTLVIPRGAPITVTNGAMEMLPVVRDKVMTYQNSKTEQYIY